MISPMPGDEYSVVGGKVHGRLVVLDCFDNKIWTNKGISGVQLDTLFPMVGTRHTKKFEIEPLVWAVLCQLGYVGSQCYAHRGEVLLIANEDRNEVTIKTVALVDRMVKIIITTEGDILCMNSIDILPSGLYVPFNSLSNSKSLNEMLHQMYP